LSDRDLTVKVSPEQVKEIKKAHKVYFVK